MISNRSAWLALAAVTVLGSSCLHSQRVRHRHALAVKAEAEADLAHAQAQALRAERAEPEYFEGDAPPAVPAAMPEERPSAPSSAHVWISGHHTRHEGRWVWVAGHYAVPPRSDVVWVPGHWVAHLHGFAWIGGGWR
jgi:hypothetical protein